MQQDVIGYVCILFNVTNFRVAKSMETSEHCLVKQNLMSNWYNLKKY